MTDEQYLTEKHYLVCDKGTYPLRMVVTSQSFTKMSGYLAATKEDKMHKKVFLCLGKVAFVAGVAAGLCCMIPGPGWVAAAAIGGVLLLAAGVAYLKCKSASTTREWMNYSPVTKINSMNALTLSSKLKCKAQGGTITPKETLWQAWGSAALTNLGHLADFAFGFLAGRGMGSMAMGATSAAGGMGSLATRQGATTFAKEFGRQFVNTAKKEMIDQFTFKGFFRDGLGNKTSMFCKAMRGLGIGGAYYDQYNIWSSDKDVLDKIKDSGVSLIFGIFAAKGATTVCFPEGTQIHTQNGLKDIKDIQEGELFLTFNEQTGEQEYKPVLVKHERYTLQMCGLELANGEILQVTPEHRFYSNGEWVEARELQPGDLLQNKDGDYVTILGIENLPHYEKVYNFDVQDNENYYVTEEGILVHNGYKTSDGDLLESDIAKALDDADISFEHSKDIFEGAIKRGEIDFETADWIIEATVGKSSKLSQMKKYFSNLFNPEGKPVVLIGPNYKNSNAIKDIEGLGAKVVHSIDDLIELIK